jgi:phenylacetate-CoA ligase
MNKLSYIENYENLRVAEQNIPFQQGPVFIQKTSGSTGIPLAIPQDTMKRKRRIAEMKYFNKTLGFNSHEKLLQLRTWNKWQKKTAFQAVRENIIPFDIKYFGDSVLESLCRLIEREKPVCIRGYASTLGRLAEVAERTGIKSPCSLKIIISTSEFLEDGVRADIKRIFNSEIVSQYANEECGILANECVSTSCCGNPMYFNNASYFFEILKLDCDEPVEYGELGRIVVTDLHNYAFPVIRYDTGDTCILLPPDEYSKGYPVIGKLYGRRFDLTYTTDGTPVYPLAYGRTIKNYPCIAQWQFIQKEEKKYQFRFVFNDKQPEIINKVIEDIKDLLGKDAEIELMEMDDIPVLTSGKMKPVVNEWNRL